MIVYLMGKNMDIKDASKKYFEQRKRANQRGIEFLITFEQWVEVWEQSGKWDQRGAGRGKYNMSRIGDTGPYAVNNVFIQSHEDNISDAHLGKVRSDKTKMKMRKPKSEAHKMNMRKPKSEAHIANLCKPQYKITCPHCNTIGGNAMKRWHFDKCKRKAA
jgi:hypothetical protein